MRAAPDVLQNAFDGGMALLNLRTGECCELDQAGAEIWGVLCRDGSPRAAAEHLARFYEVAAPRAEGDVVLLAKGLLELGMLVLVTETQDA
jgi:hypothetical protein